MNRIVLATIFAFLSLPSFAQSQETKERANNNVSSLRNWSISQQKFGHGEGTSTKSATICGMPDTLQSFFLLTRKDDKNVVAVVGLRINGSLILNPQGFEYGPIPALRDLRKNQARELWGTKIASSGENEQSYTLYSKQGESFQIDLKFAVDHVTAYRITSRIAKPEWIQVY